jgi:hypothetical protein
MGVTNPPPAFDFDAYLDFLEEHGHNFARLWRYELTEWKGWDDKQPPMRYIAQHPWKRTGPGKAFDGLPKFDFKQWDDVHFERLRSRVRAAHKRGIYVSIMLFDGWCLRKQPSLWAGHPMNEANNINGINGDPNGDGYGLEVQMLKVDAITELQKAYIRKVIDTVNEFDNVLYEISNESRYLPDIVKWQVQMIDYINNYQAGKPKQHPVGMTNLIAYGATAKQASNDALNASPAQWVSPGSVIFGPDDPYSINPPAATGRRVEILDSDHTWNNAYNARTNQLRADHAWVWKSFLRGYNPIYMDPLDLSKPNGVMEYAQGNTYAIVSARPAMGHTRAYAAKIDLAAMSPQDALASSGYCLANVGKEYLVYSPSGRSLQIDLTGASGEFAIELFNPRDGKASAAKPVRGGAKQTVTLPDDKDWVVYLLKS